MKRFQIKCSKCHATNNEIDIVPQDTYNGYWDDGYMIICLGCKQFAFNLEDEIEDKET